MPHYCPKLDKAPYVCNNCSNQDFCSRVHAYYHAQKANNQYISELSSSRKSLHIDERKAKELDKLISPLIKKGQSISHIFSTHKKEIALSRKTIYNYIDRCVFEARNIDLPRKVRYKKRKTKPCAPYANSLASPKAVVVVPVLAWLPPTKIFTAFAEQKSSCCFAITISSVLSSSGNCLVQYLSVIPFDKAASSCSSSSSTLSAVTRLYTLFLISSFMKASLLCRARNNFV